MTVIGDGTWPARIGIGLPSAVPGGSATLVEWARRAEVRGFSTLGVIDRLLYDNVEPLVALSAAASVTDRVRLAATVLLAPLRSNTALFAKQLASIDAVSGGRLVAGMGVGVRRDDYEASGVDYERRGRLLDAQLDAFARLLAGTGGGDGTVGEGRVGPVTSRERPEILVGGLSQGALRRFARFGDGWISGRAGLPMFREGAPLAMEAWRAAGRAGKPLLAALGYFALGDGARARADAYLGDYYGFSREAVEAALRDVAVTPGGVRDLAASFGEAGCEELVLFPCDPDPDQVDLLADALGWRCP